MTFYGFCKSIFGWIVRAMHRVSVTGLENVEKGKNYLICANHLSLSDPVVLASVLDCEPMFMAKKELFSIPLLRLVIKTFGAYPIDRKNNDVGAVKKTIEMLKGGKSVIMFPQGTRCPRKLPSQTTPKGGCFLIAMKSGASVLPIHIETKGYKQSFLRKTFVTIGKPITNDVISQYSDFSEGSKMIFNAITENEGKHQ